MYKFWVRRWILEMKFHFYFHEFLRKIAPKVIILIFCGPPVLFAQADWSRSQLRAIWIYYIMLSSREYSAYYIFEYVNENHALLSTKIRELETTQSRFIIMWFVITSCNKRLLSARIEKKSQAQLEKDTERWASFTRAEGRLVESGNERSNILEERSYQAVQPVIPVFASDQIGDWFVVETLVEYILRSLSRLLARETLAEWQMVWPWKRHSRSFVFLLRPVVSSIPFFASRARHACNKRFATIFAYKELSRRCYNSISWRIATTRLAKRTCSRKFISVKFNDWSHKAKPR